MVEIPFTNIYVSYKEFTFNALKKNLVKHNQYITTKHNKCASNQTDFFH